MVNEDANIILGSVINPDIGNEIMVTVIATGFSTENTPQYAPHQKPTVSKVTMESRLQQVASMQQGAVHEKSVEIENPSLITADSFDLGNLDTPAFLRKKASAFAKKSEVHPELIKVDGQVEKKGEAVE